MPGRSAQAAVILALVLAGCGSQDEASPAACLQLDAGPVARALERAPASVRLAGGVSLSHCVRVTARRDAELQQLSVRLMHVADGLRASAATDPAAALRLGYLVGAVRRGAAQTPGLAAQLARRVAQVAVLDFDAVRPRAELERGIRLGEAGG